MTEQTELNKNPVRVLRESLGLSQAKMARLINVPMSTYQAVEYFEFKELSNRFIESIREAGIIDEQELYKLVKAYKDLNANWKDRKAKSLLQSPLRQIRQKVDMTALKFAILLETSLSYVIKLELGQNRKIGKKIIKKLLEARLIDNAEQLENDYKEFLKLKRQELLDTIK